MSIETTSGRNGPQPGDPKMTETTQTQTRPIIETTIGRYGYNVYINAEHDELEYGYAKVGINLDLDQAKAMQAELEAKSDAELLALAIATHNKTWAPYK
jgi:hypothetical protein